MYTYSVKWLFWEFAVEFTQCQTLNDRIIIKLMRFTLEQSVLNPEKLCKFNPITVLFSLTVAIDSDTLKVFTQAALTVLFCLTIAIDNNIYW